MEKYTLERKYFFDDKVENWEAVCDKALSEMDGNLYLIDAESRESVEAEIVFMYSTRQYTGFFCKGIVKIGDRIGAVCVDCTGNIREVFFREDNALVEEEAYNKKIKEIVEDLDDDCRYSKAIHVLGRGGIEGMKRLVKQYHAMQRRNDNPEIPYTEHLYGVASVFQSFHRY